MTRESDAPRRTITAGHVLRVLGTPQFVAVVLLVAAGESIAVFPYLTLRPLFAGFAASPCALAVFLMAAVPLALYSLIRLAGIGSARLAAHLWSLIYLMALYEVSVSEKWLKIGGRDLAPWVAFLFVPYLGFIYLRYAGVFLRWPVRGNWRGNGWRLAAVALALALIGEGGYRATGHDQFAPDAQNLLDLRPHPLFAINELGFRGEMPANHDGLFVYCVDGSATFGAPYLYQQDASYVRPLQERLRARLRRDDLYALNLGVPGYNLEQNLIRIGRFAEGFRPALVVATLGANEDFALPRMRTGAFPLIFRLDKASHLAATWLWYYLNLPEPADVKEFRARLPRLKALAGELGCRLLLCTEPASEPAEKAVYSQALRDFAEKEGVPLVDLERAFAGRGAEWTVDGEHPNRAGHLEIARMLDEAIATHGLLSAKRDHPAFVGTAKP